MQELIGHLFNTVGPILLCVLVGFGLAKFRRPFDNKMVGSLVSNVGYPTLILSHLSAQHISIGAFFESIAAALSAVACFGAIGFLFLTVLRLPVRALLSPLMFNNVGNIGLPVAMLAFGSQGLAYAIAFLVVVLLGIFTLAMWLPQGQVSFADLLRKPAIYAVVLAVLLMATDTPLPPLFAHTFGILGGLAIPLMLLTLGHTLATLKLEAVWRGCYLAAFHLAMSVGVALLLVSLFGLTGTARGVFILLCVMPTSVATYLWVDLYRPEDAPTVASLILISTLASIVVLPVVLTVWI